VGSGQGPVPHAHVACVEALRRFSMVAYAGIFDTEEKAQTAFKTLSEKGLSEENLLSLESTADLHEAMKSRRKDDFLSGIEERINDARAEGRTIVIVRPPLGMGDRAVGLLESAGAEKILEADVKKTRFFSQVFGLPLITKRRNVQTGTPIVRGHITGGLLTKKSTSHITGGLLTKKSTSHVAAGSVTKKRRSHVTGGLLTRDRTHILGFFPLISRSSKEK